MLYFDIELGGSAYEINVESGKWGSAIADSLASPRIFIWVVRAIVKLKKLNNKIEYFMVLFKEFLESLHLRRNT